MLSRNVVTVGGVDRPYSYHVSPRFRPDAYNAVVYALHDNGQTVEGFIQQIVEKEVLGANGTQPTPALPAGTGIDEILAPVREDFERSGMTDDELSALLEEARDEARRERPKRKSP